VLEGEPGTRADLAFEAQRDGHAQPGRDKLALERCEDDVLGAAQVHSGRAGGLVLGEPRFLRERNFDRGFGVHVVVFDQWRILWE